MSIKYEQLENRLSGNQKKHKLILVDAREAAKMLSISPRTLWMLTKNGEIPSCRIGMSVRYAIKDLEKLVNNKMNK